MIFDTWAEWRENQLDDLISEYDEFRQLFELKNTAQTLERWFTALSRMGADLPRDTKEELRNYVAEHGEDTGGNRWDT
jgi:hypothetical protein